MILRLAQRHRDTRRVRRGGFTLVEILLAALIASMVLFAVYLLLNSTLGQTQATRDAIEVEDVSRSVFNKFTVDLSGTLSPLPPKSGGNSAASGGGQTASSSSSATPSSSGTPSSGGTTGSGSTPSTNSSSTPSSGTPSTSAPSSGTTDPSALSATDNATATAADYSFQAGVIGDEKKLTIYAGRVPESLGRFAVPDDNRSDQRQIIYWLGKGANGGLYRRERPWVTADGVRDAIEDDEAATDSALLAEEVTDLTFEYFDGSAWQTTWDGTVVGDDGVTPKGPPRAVRVTLTLQMTISKGQQVTQQMSQVIPIRTAPGIYTPPLVDPATDGGDNPVDDPNSSGGSTTPSGNTAPGGGNTTPGSSTPGRTQPGSGPATGATPGRTPTSGAGGGNSGARPSAMPSSGGNNGKAPSGGNPSSGGRSGSSPSGGGGKGGGR